MKRKISTRKLKRKTRKSRDRQRGGSEIVFKVLVFSDGPLSSDTNTSIQDTLTELYGSVEEETDVETFLKDDFLSTTGLKRVPNAKNKHQTQFKIETPPLFLQKSMHMDTLLTALEGQIQNKLLEKEIDVSLIPAQHGLYSDYGSVKLFYVGLCSPACLRDKEPLYLNYIRRVTKND